MTTLENLRKYRMLKNYFSPNGIAIFDTVGTVALAYMISDNSFITSFTLLMVLGQISHFMFLGEEKTPMLNKINEILNETKK